MSRGIVDGCAPATGRPEPGRAPASPPSKDVYRLSTLLTLLAFSPSAACTVRDTIASADGGDAPAAYCAVPGPPRLGDGTCTGALAEDVFRHAVCACGSLSLSGDATTDGFDSRVAPYAPGGLGAPVATRGELDAAQGLTVGGDLIVAGAAGIEAGATLVVSGDLATAGPLGRSSSAITVAGAARIAGDIDVASLDVAGALTTSPGAARAGAISAGSEQSAAVDVPPPCRCDEALDVAAIVAAQAVDHHDAAIDLDPAALVGVDGDATLELPCGRYYLDEIRGNAAGTITIRATGRVVLAIGGDITAAQGLTLAVADGAELDVLVDGTIQVNGPLVLGDPARPRALRVYVNADGSINVPAGSVLAANLHAPLADLALTAPSTELYGALVVDHITGGAALDVHHDRAITDASATCE